MTDKLSERDEIEALLPWYVTGRLDARERARVDRYVREHPEVEAHLVLAREESDATIASNQTIAAPGPQTLDRLRASVAAAPRRQLLGARKLRAGLPITEHFFWVWSLANWLSPKQWITRQYWSFSEN